MEGDIVHYPSSHPDGEATGLLFGEPTAGSKGVVLLHEWWGIDEFAKSTSQHIQDLGFVALVADVFRGKIFTDPKKARENIANLDYEHATEDVCAAGGYLKSHGCAKVAVIGFGFGASLSLVAAAMHAEHGCIDAVVPNCGVPKPEVADLAKIKCPVQGHYAANDKVIGVSSPDDYNGMAEKLWSNDVSLKMCIYDAEHAFVNPKYPMYSEEKTMEYYDSLLNFLNENLSV